MGTGRRGRRDAGGGAGAPALRLSGRSGRSLVWSRAVTGETLCLLTSKAASAASAAFEAGPRNPPSGRLNPPPGRLHQRETKLFPSSAWFSAATRWLSLCTQRYLFLRLMNLADYCDSQATEMETEGCREFIARKQTLPEKGKGRRELKASFQMAWRTESNFQLSRWRSGLIRAMLTFGSSESHRSSY